MANTPEDWIRRMQARKQAVNDSVRESLEDASNEVRNEAIRLIDKGKKSGSFYPLTDGGGTYRASAAGEAPAVDTGTLKNRGILIDTIKQIGKRLTVEIGVFKGPALLYARFLEEGTRLMRPRPFMKPATDKARPSITQIFIRNTKRALRKVK